jgi:hypothetical protein
MEQLLLQGYSSGPWRTVVYHEDIPGPRLAPYRKRFAEYRWTS